MQSIWEKYEGTKRQKVMDFAEEYKNFLSNAKTEREQVTNSIALAEKFGFRSLSCLCE